MPLGRYTSFRADLHSGSMPTPVSAPATPRLVALDWLRTLSVACVVIHHLALVYVGGSGLFAVGGGPSHPLVGPFNTGAGLWRMPLLFLVAGAAMAVTTGRLGTRAFLALRTKRLLVPLAFGMFIAAAPQRYLEAYPHESPLQFAAHAGWTLIDGGQPRWYHLWFIPYLFITTLVGAAALPVLRTRGARWAVAGCGGALAGRYTLLGCGAVVAAALNAPPVRVALALDVVPGIGGARLLYLGLFFAAGALVVTDARLLAAIGRDRRGALSAAVVCAAAVTTMLTLELLGRPLLPDVMVVGGRRLTCEPWVVALVSGAGAWCGVAAALGYALRHLRRTSPTLEYLRDASFPLYILHQPVLLCAAFALRGWNGPPLVEIAALLVLTLTVSLTAHEYLIRRTPAGRLVFGLPARVATQRPPEVVLRPVIAPGGVTREYAVPPTGAR